MKKGKVLIVLLICLSCIVTSFSLTAFAANNDNIAYSFKMKANLGRSYSSSEYRGTLNPKNSWKVNMTYSDEGTGTAAIYFLASANILTRTQLSDAYTVKQGSGAHYYAAYAEASERNVALGCKNNNDVAKSYTVSGYWDEETGVIVN